MKTPKVQKLIRKQVSKKLELLRESLLAANSVDSWSKFIRNALGMSGSQLAKRMGLAQNTISSLEKREIEDKLTLSKLKELANAMECEFTYCFVPKRPLEDIIFDQAKLKALKSIERSDTHMSLENQKVTSSFNDRLKELIEDKKYSKYLWDKDE